MKIKQIRVFIVEDDAQLRNHLSRLVLGLPEVEECKTYGSIKDATQSGFENIDLALLDIGLPDGKGIDLIKFIRKTSPKAKILIFTVFGDQKSVIDAFDAGADGFLLKDSHSTEIRQAIKSVMEGGAPISARAAAYLLANYRRGIESEDAHEDRPHLSPRELELLQLLSRGFSYKQAARKMGISPRTVSEYAVSLYRKLAVKSKGEAVYEAIQHGLLKL